MISETIIIESRINDEFELKDVLRAFINSIEDAGGYVMEATYLGGNICVVVEEGPLDLWERVEMHWVFEFDAEYASINGREIYICTNS